MKTHSIVAGCALLGVATWTLAQDVDGRIVAYRAASAEATGLMVRITDGASAKANQAALDAALAKQRAAEAALNAESRKLKLTEKKDGEKMEAVMAEQSKANEAISAQQLRLLANKDTGEVVGRSFRTPTTPTQKQ
jgi:hypothetical protein